MKNRPDDFLTAYINTIGNIYLIIESNPKLTEEHAIQQYIMLIFAGVDTTSNLFGACCYALAIHPEW
jgi:cytochrome P450